jgi:hypothetical protein
VVSGLSPEGIERNVTEYTPAEQGEIRADLTEMYRAGRVRLPERAESLAGVAEQMSGVIDTVNARAAQMGDSAVLLDVLDMAVDCQAGVARSVETLNNLATGVVAVADDFVGRDEFARDVFNGLTPDLRTGEVPQTEVPDERDKDVVLDEGVGSEYESNPDVQSPEDELGDRDEQLEDDQSQVPLPQG